MHIYKTIIVDDEIAQQELLCDALSKHFPQIEVCAICPNAESAMVAVATHHPQLVFLDVEMPGKSGIEFLQQFQNNIPFEVIFASSHANYAVNAFEVAAVHYLLKPFSNEQLAQAVTRFEERLKTPGYPKYLQNLMYNLTPENVNQPKIAATTTAGTIFLEANDIVYCSAGDKCSVWHLTDRTQHIVPRSLKECEKILTDVGFYRVHSSYLVNIKHIKKHSRKNNTIILSNNKELEVSRKMGDDFYDGFLSI